MTAPSARRLSRLPLVAVVAVVALLTRPRGLVAHPLCGITAELDTDPRTVADGATLPFTAEFCDVTGVDGGLVELATFPLDPLVFVPGSGAWGSCPTGGCSIDAGGALRIPAFSLPARGCVTFAFTLRLQPGQRGLEICEQGAMRVRAGGSPIPCDRPSDDPLFPNTTHATCVTVDDPAPACEVHALIAPGGYGGCAGSEVELTAINSYSNGCGPFSYQWTKDGVEIPGATRQEYVIPASTPPTLANYRCEVACLALPACRQLSQVSLVILLGPGEVVVPDLACAGQPIPVSMPGAGTCSIDCGNGAPPVSACVAGCVYPDLGQYTVTATGTEGNGCTATSSRVIDVIPAPSVCIEPVSSICELPPRGPTHLRLASCSPSGLALAWSSSSGTFDDPAARAPLLTLPDVSAPLEVTVTLQASAPGCGAPAIASALLTLRPAPLVSVAALPVASCPGQPVSFVATAGGSPGPLAYDWDFGDGGGSSEAAPAHAYAAPGSYDVRLVVSDAGGGCATEAAVTVPVGDACCWLAAPEVTNLVAVRRPTRDDVSLFWDTPAIFEAYNIWAVASREAIPGARFPGGGGVDPVCLALRLPACGDALGALGPPGTARFYQVRGLCSGQEGP